MGLLTKNRAKGLKIKGHRRWLMRKKTKRKELKDSFYVDLDRKRKRRLSSSVSVGIKLIWDSMLSHIVI